MPRILVADDNTNIQKMVSLAFEERGIDVVSVGNGEAAVRRIPDLNPDLVLADVFMPVRNGYEVCEFVKKDDRFSHVPVILLVGAFDPLDEKEARRVGADGVLKKPFVPPDPLIAMVTSALEKNPKVAAEMAKAREAAAAPPPPEPIAPVLEAPARMEPKPLPEFPEPTPEEAAQIYGFGKGVRSTDDEEVPADERESAKGLKAPKASSKKRREEEDEDDDDAMTAHDWRRSAGDFEVPEEFAGKLAFTPEEESNPITFPSERDVPPKRVSRSEFEAAELPEAVGERAEAPRVEATEKEKESDRDRVPETSALEAKAPSVPEPTQIAKEPEPVALASVKELQPEPESASVVAPQLPAAIQSLSTISTVTPATESPAVAPNTPVKSDEPETDSGHPPKSKIGAWMDMMTAPSEYSDGGWLSGIFGHRSDKPAQNPGPGSTPEGETPAPIAAQPAESGASNGSPLAYKAKQEQQPFAPVRAGKPEPLPVDAAPEAEPVETESSVADAPEPESWFAPPPPPILHDASESSPLLVASAQLKTDSELVAPDLDVTGSRRDPALEEAVAASRVVPEPLLVRDDEEPSEPSRFSRSAEQPSPLHSFFAPASGDPGDNESPKQEDPARHEEFNTSFFAPPAEAETPSVHANERIPTGPPPNREALADIPFLMPPPPSPFESKAEKSAQSPAQVDAVVAKVLEKLGPQLHELLSQSVLKPLVENLLQQELEKKEK